MREEPHNETSPSAFIPTEDRHQSLEWSLVLASQAIEHSIERTKDGWGLEVSPGELIHAQETLRLYQLENLRWRWRGPLLHTRLIFDWGCLMWVGMTVAFYVLSTNHAALKHGGLMRGESVAAGEWWRLFTATLLHADVAHLATNAVFGLVLLGLAMGQLGTGIGLLLAYLAGAGGNLIAMWVRGSEQQSLGASGVVMGALGLLVAQAAGGLQRRELTLRKAVAQLAGGIMIFVLLGLSPGTDVIAHAGGFACGAVLGATVFLAKLNPHGRYSNQLALLMMAALVLSTWWLALRRAALVSY